MFLDKSAMALMKQRTSVRTYEHRPVETQKLSAMAEYLQTAAPENPFGAKVRFAIMEGGSQKLGTYGFIKGAKTFFGGCVKKGAHDMEGFGYAFEKAVLFATALGWGTCWLGGTFKRSSFASLMKPSNEFLPAVSPIGYAAEKKTLTEKAVAASAGARKRKRFGELFHDGNAKTPLFIENDVLNTCLEMVRIAPSASNKQPWRVIRCGDVCHFYMALDRLYAGNTLYGFCMQRIDMGIAACHFELAAKELGLGGGIVIDDPELGDDTIADGWHYIFSWR